jgi:hypothetical protein
MTDPLLEVKTSFLSTSLHEELGAFFFYFNLDYFGSSFVDFIHENKGYRTACHSEDTSCTQQAGQ